jgi:protein SCO1/2
MQGLRAIALRLRGWAGILALACALLSVLGAGAAQSARWGSDYLPNVTVLDHDGRPLRFYDDLIKGRIVVISFIYTSCSNICPLTTARLAEVQEALGDVVGRDVFFVSVSIDPIPDTPEKLGEYKAAFRIGPGWSFVTGAPEDIDLVRYKLGERSGKSIAQHKNEVLMYNDVTGEWSRDSAFADLGVLTMNIRAMKPEWRNAMGPAGETGGTGTAAPQGAEPAGQALFAKACASCHTIGQGDKVGPDLAGLRGRRSRVWITDYLTAPQRLRAARDKTALELMARYPSVRMPSLGLSETDVDDLVSYIETRLLPAAAASP